MDRCTEKEFNEFKNLNYKYKKKFGFTFIISVKGQTKIEILNKFKQRISSDIKTEFNQATKQVKQIARLRLDELNSKEL